ncbi:MAG: DUF305 domain-containing protein [Candidatus Saccharimonadales bacterium]
METKLLAYGVIGFLLGGLVVSIAATQFDTNNQAMMNDDDMSMSQMTMNMNGKTGDEFDKAFLSGMIMHHEGALKMAELSADNAKHDEIKKLSVNIIAAQKTEISQMKQWQKDWGYDVSDDDSQHMNSMH